MNRSRIHQVHRSPAGFTMLEMLVVITVAGLLMGIMLPKMGPVRDGAGVSSAKQVVMSYLATARQTAIRRGGTASLKVAGNTLLVTSTLGGVTDTIAPPVDVSGANDVTLTSSVTEIQYNSRGLARLPGGSAKVRLTRNTRVDSLCVTLLGMVGKCGL